ncbi:hypothetical protein ISF_02115 [Cordyceps fumosorosea ARSEF 2679]|uniref:Dim2-associated protein 1, variant 1 n=1 Tax=Cordyceps fumosorosea (strain ARSEF 2679) TaxID=1081104 RepID=A0A162LJT9_CORFA|nr:hypothetical protein ISF_02115 [Cordyceps fumosorosea ARSEF 2679]OAA71564.1 hypothetical protein ISF_02115 [Cordyceps fumosorosea ARSEF 2679]
MGADRKIPPLPAPTETDDTTTPTELATDLTTDVSKPGDDKSTYSLPEDGTPVTIRTRGHKANKSQTSLLIEYFEGGKGSSSAERKPSVRVRLTPSKKGKGDHFQVTETKGSRKVSLTRRTPLDQASGELQPPEGDDAHSMTSYASATEESNVSRNPIDIEIERSHRRRRPASPLIPSDDRVSYMPGNPSDISAIPTDSFLDGTGGMSELKHSKGDIMAGAAATALAGAVAGEALHNRKTRSDKERTKVQERSRDKSVPSDKKRRSKSRTGSIGDHTDDVRSPRRRSSRTQQESHISGGDSSLLSSNLSAGNRSVKSSASKTSSINNPKLLETVEDAIRRLILPELSALKREQSKREGRRSSIASTGTSISRDDVYTEKRRSSGQKSDFSKENVRHKEKRNREARHDYENVSLHSPSQDSLGADYTTHEEATASPHRDGNLLRAAAAGAAGAMAAKGISSALDDDPDSTERKQRDRRRRRADHSRSRSVGRDVYVDEFDDDEPAPPMPLMSDINPSEVTRTSILSAETDRPHSATEELAPTRDVQEHMVSVRSTPTPSRSPGEPPRPLSMQHANVSHGDLTNLPRGQKEYVEEYETDEFGRKVPVSQYDYYGGQASREVPEYEDYVDDPYSNSLYNNIQDVPHPLKYVPYQAGARGLSPIPSVSGYTEGGSEAPLPRTSKSMQSVDAALSSPEKSPDHRCQAHSIHSIDSLQLGSPAPQFAAGQEVRGISANPNVVNPPLGVESAVASLVDGSMVDQSVVTGMSGYENGTGTRVSALSYDEPQPQSRGASATPDKMSIDRTRELDEETRHTPTSRSAAQSQDHFEYDLDEHGRKVPRTRYRNSPTASEAAITAGAVGAAAAALKAAQERKQADIETYEDENFQPAGVNRNRSFKERAMGWKPRETPTHSLDNFDYEDEEAPRMTASGMPDMGNPMPEIGYHMDDDLITNPSLANEPLDRDLPNWDTISGKSTPTPRTAGGYEPVNGESSKAALGMAAGAAAALGAAALAAHNRDQEPEEDWGRTSAERKRDTLITNPYEDASPIANPTLDHNMLERGGVDGNYATPYGTASPGLGQKYDEGYMSNGPNRTPDIAGKSRDVAIADNLDDDPFYVSDKANPRHMSGFSQGMQSPFYDAATGAGIERIENKDIVALMQHLMVRDAQRSARDTEIVALLMNAAVEMRNSFREMKELVQDTGDDVIFSNVDNTEKLQKAINGPRPFPGTATRSLQSASQAGTLDEATKKKNLWKRALQGLSAKGTNDLSRIEDMLVQLLGEVDVLKSQTAPPISSGGQGQSLENLQPEGHYEQDKGYEPEGTSTASHASVARAPTGGEHKYSDHRISTVQENEEEYQYDLPSAATVKPNAAMLSPGHANNLQRGGSVPPETSPETSSGPQHTALSADNTPRSEKGKKHKSTSSSGWIPKISRWSETTASSVGRAFRGSGSSKKAAKYDEFQPPSRSGSSLASYDDAYVDHDPYGEDKLHTGFSDPNLSQGGAGPSQPQPTVPPFALSEDPKYKAHRNSVNLQHPQPRQGQTERHQAALEYSAREYDNPLTPRSTDWAGSATSLSRLPANRYSVSSGATRDADYALSSPKQQQQQQSSAPPRPPKEPLDPSLHTPVKGNRVASLQKSSPVAHMSYESGYGSATGTYASQVTADGSPKPENRNLNAVLGIPARRPSGPRAMTPKSPEEEAAREERRRKRDTFGTMASQDTDTF